MAPMEPAAADDNQPAPIADRSSRTAAHRAGADRRRESGRVAELSAQVRSLALAVSERDAAITELSRGESVLALERDELERNLQIVAERLVACEAELAALHETVLELEQRRASESAGDAGTGLVPRTDAPRRIDLWRRLTRRRVP
jgi:chromosome segregation ATPase